MIFGLGALFGNASDVDQLQQRVGELVQELQRKDHDLRNANFHIEQLNKHQNALLAKNNDSTSSLETQREVRWLHETAWTLTHIVRLSVCTRQGYPWKINETNC
jgi:hypothetical protein